MRYWCLRAWEFKSPQVHARNELHSQQGPATVTLMSKQKQQRTSGMVNAAISSGRCGLLAQ